jgi:hypothetical protein
MKLLIDMNLSPRWVPFLAASQVEAIHWSSVGAANPYAIGSKVVSAVKCTSSNKPGRLIKVDHCHIRHVHEGNPWVIREI